MIGWFKPTLSGQDNVGLMGRMYATNNTTQYGIAYRYSSKVSGFLYSNTNGDEITTNSTYTNNVLIQYALVVEGGIMKLYINGINVATSSIPLTSYSDATGTITKIGGIINGFTGIFYRAAFVNLTISGQSAQSLITSDYNYSASILETGTNITGINLTGATGLSAYQIAVQQGYTGTITQWNNQQANNSFINAIILS